MEEIKLSPEQAYLTNFAFLEEIYRNNQSDVLGSLLGSMLLKANGETMDPAIAREWTQAMNRVLLGSVDARFKG